jgi:hypothetical protein
MCSNKIDIITEYGNSRHYKSWWITFIRNVVRADEWPPIDEYLLKNYQATVIIDIESAKIAVISFQNEEDCTAFKLKYVYGYV